MSFELSTQNALESHRVKALRAHLLSIPNALLDRNALKLTQSRMLELLEQGEALSLRRTYPQAHFTASAFICSAQGEFLALHHRKLNRWLQPGGHLEIEDTDPLTAALREAREESGLTDLIALASHPIDLDIHRIPARSQEPEHDHFDIRYALLAPQPQNAHVSEESHSLCWLAGKELSEWRTSEGSIERAVVETLKLLNIS